MSVKANVKSIAAAGAGRHHVEGVVGLILHVGAGGKNRRWIYRYHRADGRANEAGLGSLSDVSLADAVDRAAELRRSVKNGIDPIAAKRALRQRQAVDGTTLRQVTDQYATKFASRGGTEDIVALVNRHCVPLLGLSIATVTKAQVQITLDPLQRTTPKTAKRTLNALGTVMSYAVAIDLRPDNPCDPKIWKFIWPPVPAADHYRSMSFAQVPDFYRRLLDKGSVTSLALAWTIVTAARQSETTGVTWTDLDLEGRLWVVPAHKIKGRREHRQPLSGAALDVLGRVRALDLKSDYVFPGIGASLNVSCASRILFTPFALPFRRGRMIARPSITRRSRVASRMSSATAFPAHTIDPTRSNVVGR
jgi:integrase